MVGGVRRVGLWGGRRRWDVPVAVSAAKREAVLPGQSFGRGGNDEFFLLDERDHLIAQTPDG